MHDLLQVDDAIAMEPLSDMFFDELQLSSHELRSKVPHRVERDVVAATKIVPQSSPISIVILSLRVIPHQASVEAGNGEERRDPLPMVIINGL